jgi:hypothetical protein
MDQKDRVAGDKNAGGKSETGKKPYCKPSFRYERVFETMALSCGKITRRAAHCRFNTKS